jgi:hypothetical protein
MQRIRVRAVPAALARIRREAQRKVLLEDSTNVDGLLAAFEPVLYERHEHAILVIMTVEKRADVRSRAKF